MVEPSEPDVEEQDDDDFKVRSVSVPVGNADHTYSVSLLTLAVALFGVYVIARALRRNRF